MRFCDLTCKIIIFNVLFSIYYTFPIFTPAHSFVLQILIYLILIDINTSQDSWRKTAQRLNWWYFCYFVHCSLFVGFNIDIFDLITFPRFNPNPPSGWYIDRPRIFMQCWLVLGIIWSLKLSLCYRNLFNKGKYAVFNGCF